MPNKFERASISRADLGLTYGLLVLLFLPGVVRGQGAPMTVTVGSANADVIGTDNIAIQKAVDRVAAAGGGTVVVKAGTYVLANSVRLASHIRLRGEGPEKTILKKAPGVQSNLKLDADYGELIATVEDVKGFAPGMGVTILDKSTPPAGRLVSVLLSASRATHCTSIAFCKWTIPSRTKVRCSIRFLSSPVLRCRMFTLKT